MAVVEGALMSPDMDLAQSLTHMVKEWVGQGVAHNLNWEDGLEDLIRRRLLRYISVDGMAVILEDLLRVEDGRIEGVGRAVVRIADAVESGKYVD